MPKIPPTRTMFCFRTDLEFTHACGQVFRMSDGPGPIWDACWGYGPAKGGPKRFDGAAARIVAAYLARYCEGAARGPNWPDWGTPSAKRMGKRLEKHLAKLAAKAAA